MTSVLIRGAFRQRDTDRRSCEGIDTLATRPCEDGGRKWSEVAKIQRMPKIAGSYQNPLEEEHVADSPSKPPEGSNPLDTYISNF